MNGNNNRRHETVYWAVFARCALLLWSPSCRSYASLQRALHSHRGGYPPSSQQQQTHTQAQQSGTERGSRVLTAVATGDSSMSRCGLMELMFQGARAVGSGVGIPDPISSLESIPGPLRVNDEPCERSRLERCGVSLRWSTSPSGPSSSSPCSPV